MAFFIAWHPHNSVILAIRQLAEGIQSESTSHLMLQSNL